MRQNLEFLICTLVSPTRVFMNWRRHGQLGYRDATNGIAWTRGFFWLLFLCVDYRWYCNKWWTPDGWIWLTLRSNTGHRDFALQ